MKIFYSLILLFSFQYINAQPGIYSESDIKTQTEYITAEFYKYSSKPKEQEEKLKGLLELDRTNDATYYQLARFYLVQENYPDALSQINKAIKLYKNNKWYHLLAADIQELMLDYTAANQSIENALEIEPKNTALMYRKTHNLFKNGNTDAGINMITEIENKTGTTEKSSYLKLDYLNNEGRKEEGLTVLKNLVRLYPGNVDHMNNLALQYVDLNQIDEGKKMFKKVLAIDPENVQANISLLKDESNTSEESKYLFAIKPLVSNPNIPLDQKIKELIPYVEQIPFEKDIEYVDAIRALSESLVANYPNEAKAHAIRGDIMNLTGQPQTALKSYDRTLELNDNVYSVWAQKMEVLYALSSYKELKKFAEKTIDFYPNNAEGYFWYKISSYALNEINDATSFDDIYGFIAKSNVVNKFKFTLTEAYGLFVLNQANKGLIKLEALKINILKQDAFAQELLGDIYHSLDKPKEALKHWELSKALGNYSDRLQAKLN